MPSDTPAFLSAWKDCELGIHTDLESRLKRSKFTNDFIPVTSQAANHVTHRPSSSSCPHGTTSHWFGISNPGLKGQSSLMDFIPASSRRFSVLGAVYMTLTQLNKVNIQGVVWGGVNRGMDELGRGQARGACAVQLHLAGA